MNSKTKTLLGIAAFVIFIGLAAYAYNTLKQQVAPPDVFQAEESKSPTDSNTKSEDAASESTEAEKVMAPDFTVFDSEGNEVLLSSLFGKPIVMNFWASWCPPCKGEMPDFNKVYEEMGEEITFVMIDVVDGQRETMEKGKKHIEDNDYTFPVYYDTNQDAAYVYSVYGLPTTYFIDKDGYIVAGVESAIDEETLRKGIDLIKEQ